MATQLRLQQLDVLRAIAILLVLGRHMSPFPEYASPFLVKTSDVIIRVGWIGVDLFFVLSGFLVSGLLFKEYINTKKIDWKRFLLRRYLKIYPPFYLFIAVTVGVYLYQSQDVLIKSLLSELFFIQNYVYESTGYNFWALSWTVAVENQFYILLSVALFILIKLSRISKNPFSRIPQFFIYIASLILGLRLLNSLLFPSFRPETHLFPTHLRIDSLYFGIFLSYYFFFKNKSIQRFTTIFFSPLLFLSTFLILPAFFIDIYTPWMHTFGLTSLYLGFGCILILAVFHNFPQNRFLTPILEAASYIGIHSYSIYLWHMPMKVWGLFFIARLWHDKLPYGIEFFSYVVGSIILGIFMSILVEVPILYFRDRLLPSRSRQNLCQ
jgi:peptidoglycan/LPS O-acetylase OafA/YrhL